MSDGLVKACDLGKMYSVEENISYFITYFNFDKFITLPWFVLMTAGLSLSCSNKPLNIFRLKSTINSYEDQLFNKLLKDLHI